MRTILVLILLVFALPCAAELVEIPLTTLPGVYPGTGAERTEDFAFLMDPANVLGAFVRIVGVETVGVIECEGSPEPYPMEIGAYLRDETTGGWWSAYKEFAEAGGAFDVTLAFTGSIFNPPTWDFLGGGGGTLYLYGAPVAVVGICGPVLSAPSAEISEVTLIIDMASTVNTEPSTWSTLKAVYR